MMIAQLLNQNVDVCARLHHLRHADFRKGRRLGKYDHIIVWTMNLSHVRCKSPDMVRVEFRTTFLAYNLIRLTAASAAFRSDQKPRSISFTSTCQFVLSGWAMHASGLMSGKALRRVCDQLLKRIAKCRVGNRPGRLEPRVIKRRRHGYPLRQKPRHVLQKELRKHCT